MHIHFIGICGTAMGNVALMMRAMGHTVTGSDQNIYPPMSDLLADAGVAIMNGFAAGNLEPGPDLVVIGNRMSRGNVEVEAALDARLPYTSLPELLKHELIQGRRSIVLTGTHGKTTTSSLMAWVLEYAGRSPSFMIGGVPGNFAAGWQYSTTNDLVVLEGDEYDTAFFDKRSKFVHYLPAALLINNIEFDHADIFSSLDDILLSFRRLVNIVPGNGVIVANGDDENVRAAVRQAFTPVETFGLGERCTWRACNIEYGAETSSFDVEWSGEVRARLTVALLGEFNVRNALGVAVIARWLGVGYDVIDAAFQGFRNTRRRLELKGEWNGVQVYDDFAHHPTAIRETLRALRLRHPNNRLWGVFEPRSNTTRRNVFQRELAECFFDADMVLLAQIDRLEELPPEERLDPERLKHDLEERGITTLFLQDADHIVEHLAQHVQPGDVIAVMSNGGFGGIHAKLRTALGG
ncbi:MAG TPA: UDP-N-acetylmuramate:L-alanyl-gamma-D-glutamyl-meso-diaminopimelate ligase [Candidatus Kapabacteria bacterium]|nr:UDP-N-acetylmuramate:L-alanyl-gamma-D-glutamyl-meso-diaminopimelate ligase [Candidatus Kapabacteria bacterium]